MMAQFTQIDPVLIANGIITLGAVIGGVKISMNGIHKSLARLERGQEKIEERIENHNNRLLTMETTCKYNHPKQE